jgi:hypothetical protein
MTERIIWCGQVWCRQNGEPREAECFASEDGNGWVVSCGPCATHWQAAIQPIQLQTIPLGEHARELFWHFFDKKQEPVPAPVAPPLPAAVPRKPKPQLFSSRWRKGMVIYTAIAWVLGIILLASYSGSGGGDLSTPQDAWMMGFGLLLLASPLALAFIHGVNQGVRQAEWGLHQKVAHLPDKQRQLAEGAITAGLYGGLYLAHHEFQRHSHAQQAGLADQALHGSTFTQQARARRAQP